MEGIAITDLQGSVYCSPARSRSTSSPSFPVRSRRILATHFPSSLSTALAIDAAVQATHPVVWVPAPQSAADSAHHDDDSDQEDDDDDDQPWADSARRTNSSRRSGPTGVAVCHIQRNGLRYIAPVSRDSASPLSFLPSSPHLASPADSLSLAVDPLVPLTFLTELHETLQAYIVGPVTEGSLKVRLALAVPPRPDLLLALAHTSPSCARRTTLTSSSPSCTRWSPAAGPSSRRRRSSRSSSSRPTRSSSRSPSTPQPQLGASLFASLTFSRARH